MGSKRCPSARISPEPPLPWDGTGGSSAASSIPATASATWGRTAAWPSRRFASLAKTIPRTTRSGRASPNETPRSVASLACSARSSGDSRSVARSPKPLVTPYTVAPSSSSNARNAARAAPRRAGTAGPSTTRSPSQATRRNAAKVRSWRVPRVTVMFALRHRWFAGAAPLYALRHGRSAERTRVPSASRSSQSDCVPAVLAAIRPGCRGRVCGAPPRTPPPLPAASTASVPGKGAHQSIDR